MSSNNLSWTNTYGKKRKISKLSHQHLSNILWYHEILVPGSSHLFKHIEHQLILRFDGQRLEWKPLPIPDEIETLYRMGLIDDQKNILYKGRKVGSIKHIKNM